MPDRFSIEVVQAGGMSLMYVGGTLCCSFVKLNLQMKQISLGLVIDWSFPFDTTVQIQPRGKKNIWGL